MELSACSTLIGIVAPASAAPSRMCSIGCRCLRKSIRVVGGNTGSRQIAECSPEVDQVDGLQAGHNVRRHVTGRANEAFSGWSKTLTDPGLCAAIVDPLTFNGTDTNSHRLAHTPPTSTK